MERCDLEELLELEKRLYFKLSETMDLTRQMAEAIDRQDDTSLGLLLSMRQEPLLELQEIQSYIALTRVDLSPEDARLFDSLLGGEPAQSPDCAPVEAQIAANRRVLELLTELDRKLNRKLCGEQSCYEGGRV